jgi:hypothetical protein
MKWRPEAGTRLTEARLHHRQDDGSRFTVHGSGLRKRQAARNGKSQAGTPVPPERLAARTRSPGSVRVAALQWTTVPGSRFMVQGWGNGWRPGHVRQAQCEWPPYNGKGGGAGPLQPTAFTARNSCCIIRVVSPERTSRVEVTNISAHGIWLWVREREYFLPHEDFPWFEKARVRDVLNVQLLHGQHLFWPSLDVDLELESLTKLVEYPLVYR